MCPDVAIAAATNVLDEATLAEEKQNRVDKALLAGYKAQATDEHSSAKEAFEKVLEIDPENLDAKEGLAWSFLGLEKFKESVSLFEGIVAGNGYGDRVRVFFGLGRAYEGMGEFTRAKGHFVSYLERAPQGQYAVEARLTIVVLEKKIYRQARAGEKADTIVRQAREGEKADSVIEGVGGGSGPKVEGAKIID